MGRILRVDFVNTNRTGGKYSRAQGTAICLVLAPGWLDLVYIFRNRFMMYIYLQVRRLHLYISLYFFSKKYKMTCVNPEKNRLLSKLTKKLKNVEDAFGGSGQCFTVKRPSSLGTSQRTNLAQFCEVDDRKNHLRTGPKNRMQTLLTKKTMTCLL
jgi:hypothetical protein